MSFWRPFPNVRAAWMVDGCMIMVSFYDADHLVTEDELEAVGVGIIAVQECIAQGGSVDPSTHELLYLAPAEARDHKKVIGTVYEDHVGVWCKSLVPLWDILMHKLRAYLKTIPEGGFLANIEATGKREAENPDNYRE